MSEHNLPDQSAEEFGSGAEEYANLEHNVERAEDIAHRVNDKRDGQVVRQETLNQEAGALDAQAEKLEHGWRPKGKKKAEDLRNQAEWQRGMAEIAGDNADDIGRLTEKAYKDYLLERRPDGPYDEDRARFIADRIRRYAHNYAQTRGITSRRVDEDGNRYSGVYRSYSDPTMSGMMGQNNSAHYESWSRGLLYEQIEKAELEYDRLKHLS